MFVRYKNYLLILYGAMLILQKKVAKGLNFH
jgi:hypothetical protein